MHWPSHTQRQDKRREDKIRQILTHHPLKGFSETSYNNKNRVVTLFHIIFATVLFYNNKGPALKLAAVAAAHLPLST